MNRREFIGSIGLGVLAGLSLDGEVKAKLKSNPDLYPIYKNGKYISKDFSHLSKIEGLGLSPQMVQEHLKLYEGYVQKVNQAEAEMQTNNINEFSLKHLAFSLNGMALHDIYFSNMTINKSNRSKALTKAIEASYGNFDTYFRNLIAIASQVKGWSLTCVNLLNGRIFNYGLEDHSANFPNFVVPILALDTYEHAYLIDFGKDGKVKYIETFVQIIDWDLVSRRFDYALR